ncbi:MAG TPA: ABC transporter substrate-binding protein [Rhizomicrobium sp.]|jgi:phospholipid transport system substrate-binding protein
MLRICVIALAFALGTSAPARAADPAVDRIQSFYNALLDTMKKGQQLGMQGRFRAMEPAVDATFDLPTMMQFIVGPTWPSLAERDKTNLVAAFRRMTVANYAANFSSFGGEKFVVDPTVQQRGPDRIVQTTLVPVGDKPVPLTYRMRQAGGGWKVIDVFLEGYVSELATRRSDFASTLASGGAPALVTKMDQLTNSLLGGGTSKAR